MLKVKCSLWCGSGYELDSVILDIEEYEKDDYEIILGRAVKSGIGATLSDEEKESLIDDDGFKYIDNSMDCSYLGGFIGYVLIENMRIEYIEN